MEKREFTRQDLAEFLVVVEKKLQRSLTQTELLNIYNICFAPKNVCMRGVFTKLESANAKFLNGKPITADQACAHCTSKDCEPSEPLELTDEEKRSGKSAAEIQKERKSKMKEAWARREKEAKEAGY